MLILLIFFITFGIVLPLVVLRTAGVCGDDGAVVSLNKIEMLISSGETLPVDFTEVGVREVDATLEG